jgi:ATP-dependent DNA ligase
VGANVPRRGTELFRLTCEQDLEGILAKPKRSTYRTTAERLPWLKIKNRTYSQAARPARDVRRATGQLGPRRKGRQAGRVDAPD